MWERVRQGERCEELGWEGKVPDWSALDAHSLERFCDLVSQTELYSAEVQCEYRQVGCMHLPKAF